MTIDELHGVVKEGVRRVDEQFTRVDERFTRIDERFAQVDERFDRVDERFASVDAQLVNIYEQMRRESVDVRAELRAEIQAEGEKTRRHFDVMVEKVEAAVRLVAEVGAHHGTVLGDHEVRLQVIEKRP